MNNTIAPERIDPQGLAPATAGKGFLLLAMFAMASCNREEPVVETCPWQFPECRGKTPPPLPMWEIPAAPHDRAAYDFAHALSLPPGMPVSVPFDFKAARIGESTGGLSVGQQYFQHLCKTEASELILRQAEDVEGFRFLRPRTVVEGSRLDTDRFAPEEPTGFGWFSDPIADDAAPLDFLGDAFVQPFHGVYSHVEYASGEEVGRTTVVARLPPEQAIARGETYSHWEPYPRVPNVIFRKERDGPISRFGYTWRGIRRERDREFGIAGAEFFVLDLVSGEVLAVLRNFNSTFVPGQPKYTRWSAARECKPLGKAPTLRSFIVRTLKPVDSVNDAYLPPELLPPYRAHLHSLTGVDSSR